MYVFKGVFCNYNPIQFLSNTAISPHVPLVVHSQPRLFEWKTNRTHSYSQAIKYWCFVTTLMLCVTRASLKEHWREGCIFLATEFKYQQAFSRIADYTFNECDCGADILRSIMSVLKNVSIWMLKWVIDHRIAVLSSSSWASPCPLVLKSVLYWFS